MGVQGLFKFLTSKIRMNVNSPSIEEISLLVLKERGVNTVGIDASLYLYKCLGDETKMMKNLMIICNIFLSNNILPLFVFDGRFDMNAVEDERVELIEQKKTTIEKRRNTRTSNRMEFELYRKIYTLRQLGVSFEIFCSQINDFIQFNDSLILENYNLQELYLTDLEEISSKMSELERKTWSVGQDHINLCCNTLNILGIPYVFSYYESDSLLANLCKMNIIQAVLSEDSDLIPYGTPILLRNLDFNSNNVTAYYYDRILNELRFTREMMIDFSILLGTDFNNRLKKLIPEESYEYIKKSMNIETIIFEIFEKERKKPPIFFSLQQDDNSTELHFNKVRNIYNQIVRQSELLTIEKILTYDNVGLYIMNLKMKIHKILERRGQMLQYQNPYSDKQIRSIMSIEEELLSQRRMI